MYKCARVRRQTVYRITRNMFIKTFILFNIYLFCDDINLNMV